MVSTAFLLLTVSTLAVHGKYLSKIDQDIQRGCKGVFCDVKPANYPQQHIDRLLLKDLSLLHRRKRESMIEMPELESGGPDGNCITIPEMKQPYELKDEGQVPKIIVQSKFFEQKIPYVTCYSKDQPCFQGLIRGGSNIIAKCEQKTISSILYVYDNNTIKPIKADIPIDCVCKTVS